LFIRTTFI